MLFAEGDSVGLGYVLTALVGSWSVIVYLAKMVVDGLKTEIVEQKTEIAEFKNRIRVLESIAEEARQTALAITNYYRENFENKPRLIPVPRVVPEGSSPPTPLQKIDANIATMRAGMEQIRRESGMPPRPMPSSASANYPALDNDETTIKEDIAEVPEKTAMKVVEKLKDQETA